jgi:hypothetical protein
VQRQQWSRGAHVGAGTLLANGDHIQLEGAGALLCSDLRLAPIETPGMLVVGSDICAPEGNRDQIALPEGSVGAIRGRSIEVPFVISPRSSAISNPQPMLRWNDTGLGPYRVAIVADEEIWHQDNVAGSSFRYPGTPPLRSGVDYLLVVVDSNGASSAEDKGGGQGFSVLDEAAAQQVAADLAHIDQAGLPAAWAAYGRAWVRFSRNLVAEALEELEPVNGSPAASPASLLASGDFLFYTGLALPAQAAYLRAEALADERHDDPMRAAALAGIGDTSAVLNDMSAANMALEEARALFLALGDQQRAAEISAAIDKYNR